MAHSDVEKGHFDDVILTVNKEFSADKQHLEEWNEFCSYNNDDKDIVWETDSEMLIEYEEVGTGPEKKGVFVDFTRPMIE